MHRRHKHLIKEGGDIILEEYKDVLTVKEVMEIMRVGRNTVYEMLQSNEIPNKKVRNKYIIPKIGVENYLRNIN